MSLQEADHCGVEELVAASNGVGRVTSSPREGHLGVACIKGQWWKIFVASFELVASFKGPLRCSSVLGAALRELVASSNQKLARESVIASRGSMSCQEAAGLRVQLMVASAYGGKIFIATFEEPKSKCDDLRPIELPRRGCRRQ